MFPSGAVPIPTRGTARLVLPTLTRAFRSGIGKRIVQTSRRPLEKLQSTTTSPKFGLTACPGGNHRPNAETACSARIGSERLPLRASRSAKRNPVLAQQPPADLLRPPGIDRRAQSTAGRRLHHARPHPPPPLPLLPPHHPRTHPT